MLSVLLCAALSQAPTKVAVVHGSSVGVAAKRVAEGSQLLLQELQAQGVEPVESKLPCDSRPCVVAAGRELGQPAVISISFAPVGRDTVMDLECLRVFDGRTLAQMTFTLRASDTELPSAASSFVSTVKVTLRSAAVTGATPPAKKPDAPVEAKLTPADAPRESLMAEQPAHSRAPAIAVGAGAVVVGLVAVVLVALATNDASEANRTVAPGMAAHSRADAEALRSSANSKYTGALGAGLGAGALALTSLVLFVY